ncbi:DeoR/GlpR transcriptional regulator [Desemzia sp. RIT804]|uniref:DeoR/GlpR family DNA-binding transcription regulator n=1 Tax=Desemzia sp. RIT 804 TaxID=2810209 RepID=UPI00194F8701|nr:DeoR/GlpR family DNA-binding transcription regulator [Desemzia sp. RIT 804]MBM6614294.1 DeoR/GlpR transcriptional regulator [Desemzia sp. RIT 804]
MSQLKRQKLILDLLKVNGEVFSKTLAAELNVSMMTINRDLKELAKWEEVQLVHGGAVYRGENTLENPISIKEQVNVHEKKLIAQYCHTLIKPGNSVFIETGTTTLAVAREIFNIEDCQFYTNSLLVLNSLSKYEGIHLHSVPGKYRDLSKGFLGLETADFIKNYNFDVAFIGTEGISAQSGVTLPNREDAFTKKSILKQAKKTVLVADHKKFGLSYLHKVGEVSDFDRIVTDLNSNHPVFKEISQLTNIISVKKGV